MLFMIRLRAIQPPAKKEQVASFVFGTLIAVLVLFIIGRGNAAAAEPAGLNLIGTIVSQAFTGAVIKDGTGKQSFFRLYEALPDGSKIVSVQADSISLKGADGSLYDMFISHEKTIGSAPPPQPNAYSPVNISSGPPMTSPSYPGADYPKARRQRRHVLHAPEEEE